MATKNKKISSNNENAAAETESVKPAPKKNGNAKKEELSSSATAIIIAVVALLFIGGTIGAFFLFVKIKKNYIEPFMKSQAGLTSSQNNLSPGDGGASQNYGVVPAGTAPIGIGETEPDTAIVPTIPVETEDSLVLPEEPVIPEPEKVGSYDFDGAIAEMDGAMNNTYDTTFSNSVYSNDYFGFD